MAESHLIVRREIVGEDPDGSKTPTDQTRSTFDRLLRDYFGSQAARASDSISDRQTSPRRGRATSRIERKRQSWETSGLTG
jgi:hypothetical protein